MQIDGHSLELVIETRSLALSIDRSDVVFCSVFMAICSIITWFQLEMTFPHSIVSISHLVEGKGKATIHCTLDRTHQHRTSLVKNKHLLQRFSCRRCESIKHYRHLECGIINLHKSSLILSVTRWAKDGHTLNKDMCISYLYCHNLSSNFCMVSLQCPCRNRNRSGC